MIKLKVIMLSGSILLSTSMLPSVAASIPETGGYLGISAGRSQVDLDQNELSSGLTALGYTHTGFTTDDKGTGWKVLGGYKVNHYFFLEAAYLDLGKFTADTTITAVGGVPVPATAVTTTVKARSGLNLSAVGVLPVTEQFSIFGKVGGYTIKSTLDAVAATGASQHESARNEDFAFGVGLSYDFTPNVGVRAEWERFRNVGDRDKLVEQDVDLVSLGVVYHF